MHFGLSEEQTLLQDMLRRCLDEHLDIETLKRKAGQPCDPDLWGALVELGVPGVLIPEDHGGSGLGMMEAEVIAESMGRSVAPVPFLGTTVLAPLAWQLAGTPEQQERHLGPIATGDHRYGVGLAEVAGAPRQFSNLTLKDDRAWGRRHFVLDANDASHFLLTANGGTLIVIERDAEGVSIELLNDVDRTRSFAVVGLERTPFETVGAPGRAAQVIETLLTAGRLMLAADTFGAAEIMLLRARDYSMERFQFDRPIGSFQGVKHLLADMVTDLEPCRSLIWYAAHVFDAEPAERVLHACHAKSLASEVGKFIARSSIEIHGGMGFTEELGLHLWYKRIEANRQLLGGPETVRHAAAVDQGWVEPLTTTVT